MKKRLITVLYALLAVATITACGSDDNSKSEGSKWETESVEKEDTKTEDGSSVEESTKETEVSGVLKSKEELLSENQFYDFYMKLHGYWVNDDQTYYFGSFVKDGELVNFYTKTDDPTDWYRYDILSSETFEDFSYNDQYSSGKLLVTVSDNKGTTKEVEMDILTDFYTDQKHIDIVDGESTVNMTKLSDLMSAYNYLRFVDLKADDKGNVTLTHVDLRDTTLQAINENAREIYFCYENSDGYYAFVKDGDVYVYEGYRQEDGFRDTYLFYGVSIYPWTYEFVRNPYLEAGSEVYEPIPLSEDILSGYAYRMPDGRMLTYHGIEGMYLDEYTLAEGRIYMTFKDVEDDSSIKMRTRETSYFDQLYTGEMTRDQSRNHTFLDGIMIGTDFIVSYDPAQESKDIVVHLEKDDIDFCFSFEADNLENSYESEILKARVMLDSLTVSSGEQTVDEYLQDTIEIGDYKFSDAVQFDHIKRGKESAYGLSLLTCKDMDFRFEMEREANEVLQFDIFNMEQVYETGFGDSFEVYLKQSPTTHEYMNLYVHVPNKPNEILCVTAPDFFEYGMEFSEVEEQSKDYLLNNLLRNILVLRE